MRGHVRGRSGRPKWEAEGGGRVRPCEVKCGRPCEAVGGRVRPCEADLTV